MMREKKPKMSKNQKENKKPKCREIKKKIS